MTIRPTFLPLFALTFAGLGFGASEAVNAAPTNRSLTSSEFLAPRSAQAGNVPQGIATGDFNGDEILDLAVTNAFDDSVSVLLGDGSGGFAEAQVITVGPSPAVGDDLPREIVFGDLNADGLGDLAIINSGNPTFFVAPSVSVIEANRAGGFEPAIFPELSSALPQRLSFSIDLGAVDSDGLLDLVAGHFGSNTISFFENEGDFEFEESDDFTVATAAGGPSAVRLADVDLDGDLDLFLANDRELALMLFTDGAVESFGPALLIDVGTSWLDLALSDFDNDGALDIAAIDSDGARVRTLLGVRAMGGFDSAIDTPLPFADAAAITVEDFNQDGFMDVAVAFLANARVGVFLGDGTGAFDKASALIETGAEPRDVVAVDLDGNGVPDLATANEGDQANAANEDVTIALNPFDAAEDFVMPEPVATHQSLAGLGAGIARVAGAGWHPGRSSLYVVDPEAAELVEISAAGERLGAISTSQFGSLDPSDVAVDPASGDLFFTDRIEASVYRITSAGALVTSFVAVGSERPSGIALDPANSRLIVSDERAERVFAFNFAGVPQGSFESDEPITDLAFDRDANRLWAYERRSGEINAFTIDEEKLELDKDEEIELKEVSRALEDGVLGALAFDSTGERLWLASTGATLIEASSSGDSLAAFELGLGLSVCCADVDPATGDVWMIDEGLLGTVLRLSPAGNASARFAIQSHDGPDRIEAVGLAFGQARLYILDARREGVLEFSTAGTLLGDISLDWAEDLNLLGLEFDADRGELFVLTPGRLYTSDLSGQLLGVVPITRAREFVDIGFDGQLNRFALYARSRAEVWFIARSGAFAARTLTPAYLPPTYLTQAGALDPANPTRHFVSGAGEPAVLEVSILRINGDLAARLWTAYQ